VQIEKKAYPRGYAWPIERPKAKALGYLETKAFRRQYGICLMLEASLLARKVFGGMVRSKGD
jgi:hypothetical protein